jgi:hypothetical protein
VLNKRSFAKNKLVTKILTQLNSKIEALKQATNASNL